MKVEIAKWGNSAAVRVPAWALHDTGLQIGQSLELHAEGRRLILEPAADSLDDLLAQVTPQNRHALAFDDRLVGEEIW
jgi:antitoxin MazE